MSPVRASSRGVLLPTRSCMLRAAALTALLAVLSCPACIGNRIVYPVKPTAAELAEFEAAGPVEGERLAQDGIVMNVAGPYRVVPGDLLAIQLPSEVEGAGDEDGTPTVEIKCRVSRDGTLLLPMIGTFAAGGLTTGEIEDGLAAAYGADGVLKERPSVVVTVAEFRTVAVAVIGAVNEPGLHELRSDRRTVLGALSAAGGIEAERGARSIRVVRTSADGAAESELLAVHLSEIPLADVELSGGETIVVEPLPERSFSVTGLVRKVGVFPYPEPRRFNLMQALAFAGGVDSTAAPRYATIYRRKADGSVLAATFQIDGTALTDASNVAIKDGDVIAVEHTQGTWWRQFVSQVFGFRASFSVTGATSPTL